MSDEISEGQRQAMLDLLRTAGLEAQGGDAVTVSAGGDTVTFEA